MNMRASGGHARSASAADPAPLAAGQLSSRGRGTAHDLSLPPKIYPHSSNPFDLIDDNERRLIHAGKTRRGSREPGRELCDKEGCFALQFHDGGG